MYVSTVCVCVCVLSVLLLSLCVCSRESLVECLEKALDRLDVLVTSGGVSMGEKVCVCQHTCICVCVFTILAGSAETSAGGTFQCHHSFR